MHVLERRFCSRWHVFVINTDICKVLRKVLFPTRFESGQKVSDFVWEYETWDAEISKRESTFFILIVDVYTGHWQRHLGCSVCRCLNFTDGRNVSCRQLIADRLAVDSRLTNFFIIYIMSSSRLVPYVDLIIRPGHGNRCARHKRSPSPVIESPNISPHKRRKLQKDDSPGEKLSSKVYKFYSQVTSILNRCLS
jgi:hypothetical protein